MAARGRSGGATGFAVGLVIFVILFFLSLIAAILFYVQGSNTLVQLEDARKTKQRWVKDADEDEPALRVIRDTTVPGQPAESAVRRLWSENKKLKDLFDGNADATYEEIKAKLDDAKLSQGKTLLSVIKTLNQDLASATDAQKKLTDDLDGARKKVAQIEAEKATRDRAYAEAEAAIKGNVDKVTTEQKGYEEKVSGEHKKLEGTIADMQAAAQKSVAEKDAALAAANQKVRDLQTRLDTLMQELGPKSSEAIQPWKTPKGKVISIISDENLVYINRGRKDHLILGMTFEVFDPRRGITVDELDKKVLRGKGTIEVINISENSAAARIVRLERGQQIVEGDIIGNVVYDPNVRYKFYVYGNFDLDIVGITSDADKRRVMTMITEWGGRLADHISYDTDFLVLGLEPKLPDPPPPGTIDPVVLEQYAAKRKDWDTYQTLIGEAKTLKIPILNQNRFLAMVGYYHR